MKSNVVSTTARAIFMMAAAITAVVRCACGEEITWGGASGRWSDSSKWVGGKTPAKGDAVIFPANGECVVEIDDNTPALSSLTLSSGTAADRVTFVGDVSHRLYVTGEGYAFVVGENRKMAIAGCLLELGAQNTTSHMDVGPGARLDVDSGKLYVRNGGILVNTNAMLNVHGGILQYNGAAQYLKLAKNSTVNLAGGSNILGRVVNKIIEGISEFDGDGSKVVISGGYTGMTSSSVFAYMDRSKTEVKLSGGVLDFNLRVESDLRPILPAKGAMLRYLAGYLAMTDKEGTGGEIWELGGKAVFDGQDKHGRGTYIDLGYKSGNIMQGGGDILAGKIAIGNYAVNADLGRVAVSNFSSNGTGFLYFNDGITFGANGDVSVTQSGSSMFVPCGRVWFDTVDAVDGETLRSFDLASCFDLSGATAFEVDGAGFVSIAPETSMKYLHKFSADAGSTVVLTNSNASIMACTFTLGAGAELFVGGNAVDVANAVLLGEGAKIWYSFNELEEGKMYPLWFGPHDSIPPVPHFKFDPELPEGWTVATSGSTAYLWDGTAVGVDSEETEGRWIGSSGGNWNDTANWTSNGDGANIPGGDLSVGVGFSGNRQLSVTNDWPGAICCMSNLSAVASAGPYIISGRAMDMLQPKNFRNDAEIASIESNSSFPLTIETTLGKYWTEEGKSRSYFNVFADNCAPVVLAGGGSLTNDLFRFRGDVRIGGNWVMRGLDPLLGNGRDTRLVLLPGAYLETTAQASSYQTVASSYHVSSGACMVIKGDEWRWSNTENTHFIDGVVTSECPVVARKLQTFIGDGVISLKKVQALRTGDLKFAGNITVRPGRWMTVRSGGNDQPTTMIVRDNATIGAWGDWTYGAEEGFESSTSPADRALKVVGGAKTRVSFDTEGNTVTLTDPLVVEKWSTVVKKGEGTLVLKSSENVLSDSEFELLGGELKIDGRQSFGKLTFGGGTMAIGSRFETDSYEKIFTAKEIVGDVAVSGRYRVKAVSDDNGVSVFVRRERGTAVIVR